MSEKRKDNKGRVLRTGESQRKDGTYQYRYTNFLGKRCTVYGNNLNELRNKEEQISKAKGRGVDYGSGAETVLNIIDRYLKTKRNIRASTLSSYCSARHVLDADPFCHLLIRDIKVSDAKMWVVSLHDRGLSCSTIKGYLSLVRPSFQMACEEDLIMKNPFSFYVSKVIDNDRKKRNALTNDEQRILLEYSKTGREQIHEIIVLLMETGIRIGELCGLTEGDLDFENRYIKVDHQLVCNSGCDNYKITAPKSSAGIRFVPMTLPVYIALKSLLSKRVTPLVEPVVGDRTNFLLLTNRGSIRNSVLIGAAINRLVEKYNAENPAAPLPHITPHVLRHTYCTNMAARGMNIKALQYFMGHSTASLTLDVYAHGNYEMALEQAKNILAFWDTPEESAVRTTPFTTPFAQ